MAHLWFFRSETVFVSCHWRLAARASMSEVATILRLLMVMLAMNAVSERTASALR